MKMVYATTHCVGYKKPTSAALQLAVVASLDHKRFVLAPYFYRAGGRSWRPPAQNDKGTLDQRPPAQKQSMLVGHLTACQQR